MSVIEVNHLVKEYKVVKKKKGLKGAIEGVFKREKKIVKAVNDISFEIEQGEIVGYIGPNGAGKSTTIKMMSGILHPTGGTIKINGLSPQEHRKEVVQNLGVVFGQRSQLNWDLRLGESFELLKRIYRVPDDVYQNNLNKINDIINLSDLMDTPVRQLSLGQRMKGDLAAAMLHSPSILFLDEPTIGLDVEAKHAMRKFIKEINKEYNTTIILTTHDLDDIQELCKRIIVINNGIIIADGSLNELSTKIAPFRRLIVDYYSEDDIIEHSKATIIKVEGPRVWYEFEKSVISASELIAGLSNRNKILDLSLEESDIEDIIRQVYKSESHL